jgi:hypothetical protein
MSCTTRKKKSLTRKGIRIANKFIHWFCNTHRMREPARIEDVEKFERIYALGDSISPPLRFTQ